MVKDEMGRSDLVPFLKEALNCGKYSNLKPVKNATDTFKLQFPRKSPTLGRACQLILKDWENLKKRDYVFLDSYSSAKQRMQSDFRGSDFLQLFPTKGRELIFRFLEPEEIRKKKLMKKENRDKLSKKRKNEDYAPSDIMDQFPSSDIDQSPSSDIDQSPSSDIDQSPSSDIDQSPSSDIDQSPSSGCSSGYSSCEGSPVNCDVNKNSDHAPLPTIDYMVKGIEGPLINRASILKNDEDPFIGNKGFHFDSEGLDVLIEDSSLSLNENDNLLFGFPLAGAEELDKINNFIFSHTENYEEIMQTFCESMNSGENTDETDLPSISEPTNLNITSDRKNKVKMYECLHRLNLSEGIVVLACQCKEFVLSDPVGNVSSTSTTFIFDEATKELVSKSTIENMQLLSNGYLLVSLKCQEVIIQ